MAVPFTRTIGYNLNTRGVNMPRVDVRPGLQPTFAPRRPNGIRRPNSNYIELLEARTPTPGSSNPRLLGKRKVYALNHATITD